MVKIVEAIFVNYKFRVAYVWPSIEFFRTIRSTIGAKSFSVFKHKVFCE